MRTTLTLDDDLADALKALAHERRQPFKAVVNDAIRSGLKRNRPERKPFRTAGRPLQLKPGLNLHQASALADALDDEQIVAKLRSR